MNIFVFHPDLEVSARYFFALDFRRANKQIVELAQCLAVVATEKGWKIPKKDGTPYKQTHSNHPVCRWLRESIDNQRWANRYLAHLLCTYAEETGKLHGCLSACGVLTSILGCHTPTNVTPIHHGVGVPRTGDVYKDYRNYLNTKLEQDRRNKV